MTGMFTPSPDESMPTHHMPDTPCPWCGAVADAVSNMPMPGRPQTRRNPVDGDFSLCFTCGKPAAFVVTALGVGLRKLTAREALDLAEGAGRTVGWVQRWIADPANRRD